MSIWGRRAEFVEFTCPTTTCRSEHLVQLISLIHRQLSVAGGCASYRTHNETTICLRAGAISGYLSQGRISGSASFVQNAAEDAGGEGKPSLCRRLGC